MKARKILPRAALFALCSLVFSFFLAPGPPEKASYTALPDDTSWTPPDDGARPNLREKYAIITKTKPVASQNELKTKTTNWRFSGVIKRGRNYIALIEIDETLTRHTIGDSLPNGEYLADITNNSITIQQDDSKRVQKLYTSD